MAGRKRGFPTPRTLEDAFRGDDRVVDPSTTRRQVSTNPRPNGPTRGNSGGQTRGRGSGGRGSSSTRGNPSRFGQNSRSSAQTEPAQHGRRQRSPAQRSSGVRVTPYPAPKGNNTLTVPVDRQPVALGSSQPTDVESSDEASSYANVAKKMVAPRGFCQLRITIRDKSEIGRAHV